MKKSLSCTFFIAVVLLMFVPVFSLAQVTLNADGPGNTYELINSVLAPGYNVVEAPDAADPAFGRHITEVFDATLNKNVFEFFIHVSPDDDPSTGSSDRQRNEIKTYDQSPANLKGTPGETITYKWRFKIPTGFQPSPNFTHIHQIKAVGGDDSQPLFTLTARKGASPAQNRLEIIYNLSSTSGATTMMTALMPLFENTWVEATEVVTVGAAGAYSIVIKKVSDGNTLLTYSNPNILTFRPDNTFVRPKWGIYRSLLSVANLRDESLRFSDFSIAEASAPPVPKTYYWIGGAGPAAIHGVSANWNTTLNGTGSSRSTQAADDVLIFDGSNIGGTVPSTGTVQGTAMSANFGRLILRNAANVTFVRTASTGFGTITINGDGTALDDFMIEAGSSLKITASLAGAGLNLSLGTVSTPAMGSIAGNLTIEDNNIYTTGLYAKAPASLNILSGGKCFVNNTVTGNYPFGSGSTVATGGINFKPGSELIYRGGMNPYGAPNSAALNFEKGSRLVFEAANVANMFEARTLANVTVRNNATVSAENFYNIDSLQIEPGASFYLKATGSSPVSGYILNNGIFGAASGFSSTNLVLTGNVSQSIGGSGTFADVGAITVAANADVLLQNNLSVSGSTQSAVLGKINTQSNSISGTGNFLFRQSQSATSNATLTAGSNIIFLDPAKFAATVNTANVVVGALVSGTGIAANSYVISANAAASSVTLSKAATASAGSLSAITNISNNSATLETSNSGGVDGSISVAGTKTFGTGTNYVFNAATLSPFPILSNNATGNVTFNASATTNKSQIIGGALVVNGGVFTVRSGDEIFLTP